MQQEIYNELQVVFKSYDSFVIAIKGDWGTGKTYFWNKFKHENLQDKPYAYVSLFGKDSIADIKKDVILQISVKDKHLSSVKEKIKDIKTTFGFKEDDSNFGISGSLISAAMSLFEKKEFKDVVICIDDFERKSSKLDMKDILGYLSQLKEQFDCQIVLILNESKISEDEKVYRDYKEKIVDFEFSFEPSVEESFIIIKPKMLAFHNDFKEYCQKVGLNNIRIMKNMVRFLNRLDENVKFEHYSLLTKEILLDKVFSLLTVYYKYSSVNIKSLSKYVQSRRFDKEDDKKPFDKTSEEILTYFKNQNIFYHIDEIDKLILNFLEKSIFNFNALKNYLDELEKNNNEIQIENEFHNLQNDILYDLNIDKKQYIDKVYSFLEKNYSVVFRKTSFNNFMFYVNELKTLDSGNELKYDKLLEDSAKVFVSEVLVKKDDSYLQIRDMYHKHIFDAFKQAEINGIEEYINTEFSKRKQKYDFDVLKQVLESIRTNRGYGDYEEDIINSISAEMYKEALFHPEILEKIYSLLRDFKNTPNLKIGIDKIKEAIYQIEFDNKGANKYQISRLKFIVGINDNQLKQETVEK